MNDRIQIGLRISEKSESARLTGIVLHVGRRAASAVAHDALNAAQEIQNS